jgi:ABC-type transport system involved in multi-copper enzyme maturation permease subunit
MLKNMFLIENTKILKQRILWIEVGLMAGIMIFLQLMLYAVNVMQGSLNPNAETFEQMAIWPGALVNILAMAGAGGMGSMLVIVLAGAVVAQEYNWRTLQLWLGRGVSRTTYALAKFASLLLPILLLVLIAMLGGSLASLGVTLGLAGETNADQVVWGQFALGALRTAYTLLPYAALAFALGIVFRSAVVAIGVGLAFALLLENLLGQILTLIGGFAAGLVKFLPLAMGSVVLEQNQALAPAMQANAAGMATLSLSAAVIGIAVYTALLVGVGVWSLSRQDLSG